MKTLETLKTNFATNLDKAYRLEYDVETRIARLYQPTPKAKYSTEKNLWAYRFETVERMVEFIETNYNNRVANIASDKKRKEERKVQRKLQESDVQVGDIFVNSWGYEQTNVDFYQVVARSGVTVTLREIGYDRLETTSWASEYVRPVKDAFIKDAQEFKKRLNGKYIKMNSFSSASKVEDPATSKHYRSWYA